MPDDQRWFRPGEHLLDQILFIPVGVRVLDLKLQTFGGRRRSVDLPLALRFVGRPGGEYSARSHDMGMGLGGSMGEQPCQGAGSGPALH